MSPQKILIIDDDRMIRLTTALMLEKEGIIVFQASNGEEGLVFAKVHKPDLILLDIMMPGLDGWEILDRMATDSELSMIPVAIFTAGDSVEIGKKAKDRNIKNIIKKPFRLEELRIACGLA